MRPSALRLFLLTRRFSVPLPTAASAFNRVKLTSSFERQTCRTSLSQPSSRTAHRRSLLCRSGAQPMHHDDVRTRMPPKWRPLCFDKTLLRPYPRSTYTPEPREYNLDRNKCQMTAQSLRESKIAIPEYCAHHDPPCLLQQAALTAVESFHLSFSASGLWKRIPDKTNHPLQTDLFCCILPSSFSATLLPRGRGRVASYQARTKKPPRSSIGPRGSRIPPTL